MGVRDMVGFLGGGIGVDGGAFGELGFFGNLEGESRVNSIGTLSVLVKNQRYCQFCFDDS